ncbi:hypothetical protein Tco_0474212 [Tanacetum coccineum]
MSSETKLTKDEDGESVDNTKYRGMIGSLLYLTASRLDIMFSVFLCTRFQEDPRSSHLEAIKRIFRYIKGTTHSGLCYPKGTGVETIVYADSDHAGDYVNHKSTSGVCTFMGCCLTSYKILETSNTTPPPLTTPPPAPTQQSKQSSPLTINLEPIKLIFSTPTTSPHPFFDSLEDLPPRTTNPTPPQPTFDSIERLANQPPPVPDVIEMEPPLPLQLSPFSQPMWSNDILPPLTYETFCEHCQQTLVIVNDLRDEMRFILNYIFKRLTTLTHENFP